MPPFLVSLVVALCPLTAPAPLGRHAPAVARGAPGPVGDGATTFTASALLGHKFAPIWSPAGDAIAFSFDFAHREERFQVRLTRADGGGCSASLVEGTVSAFSADGERMLFSAFEDGAENVFEMRLDGGGRVRLTDARAPLADRDASWSHDGRRIAYGRIDRASGTRDIWTMAADGSGKRNLTASSDVQESVFPALWSPDDAWLYYSAEVGGRRGLHRIRADGSAREPVPSGGLEAFRPAPSPDGKRLAFIADPRGRRDQRDNRIFVLADGSTQPLQLGDLSPLHGTLSWSPDGERLAFNAFDGELVEVHTIRADGSELRRVTSSPEQELLELLRSEGVEAARERFDELAREGRVHEAFLPAAMNALGYRFLQTGDRARALAAFQFQAEARPDDANAWDSLGDGWLAHDERDRAIECYQKALALDPPPAVAAHARQQLEALEGGGR